MSLFVTGCQEISLLGSTSFISLPPEISGVIASYRRCLPQIQLYGPTNVAPIINRVAGPAQREQSTGQATVSGQAGGQALWVCGVGSGPMHPADLLALPVTCRSTQCCWCSQTVW